MYIWFEVYRLLSSSMNRGNYQLLCKWVLTIVLILACSSTFPKEIHFIQTFRGRKFPQISLGLLQVKRFLAAFLNAWHQQPLSTAHHFIYFLVLERVNLGRVSPWSAVLTYRAGSVLLKKFVSLAQIRMWEGNWCLDRSENLQNNKNISWTIRRKQGR